MRTLGAYKTANRRKTGKLVAYLIHDAYTTDLLKCTAKEKVVTITNMLFNTEVDVRGTLSYSE